MKSEKKYNTSNWIGVCFLVLVLIFTLSGVFLLIHIKNNLRKSILGNLKKDTQIISMEIDKYLCRYGELVAQMLTNDAIVSFVKENESSETIASSPDYKKVKATLERIKSTSNNIALAWLGMKELNCLATNEGIWVPDYDYDMETRPWYIEMNQSNRKVTYTQPYIDGITGKFTLSIVSPIYEHGRLAGSVGIDIHMEELISFIDSYSIGLKGFPILISSNDTIIYHPNMSLEALMKIEELGGKIKKTDSKFLGESPEFYEYIENNTEYYLFYNSMASNDWRIAAIIPKSEINAQMNQLNTMRIIIFGSFTTILIIIAIMFRLSNNFKELNELYEKLGIKEKELLENNKKIFSAYEQLANSEEKFKIQYATIQDYTEKIEDLKQKYDIAIKGTNSGVWEYEVSGRNFYLSEDFKNALGITEKNGKDYNSLLNELLAENERKKLENEIARFMSGGREEIYCQVNLKNSFNRIQCILIRGRGIFDGNNGLKLVSGIILDITKIKEQEKYIEYIAYYDPLTNLPNRIKFIEALEKEVNDSQPGAIMFLDLDDFKRINDTMGHSCGDKILQKVAESLLNIERGRLLVSRFGGDEFLILIKREENINEIENYAKKIIEVFKDNIMIEEYDAHVNCSIGITLYPFDSIDVNKLIMNADVAMYKAKDLAGSNYVFFNNKMADKLKEKIKIEKLLRDALKENGFTLLYQPQVSTLTGNILGFEALLRLKAHEISPIHFIPLAEEIGIIIEIGRWVTKEVVKQLKTRKEKGGELKPIAINFSAQQLHDSGYIEFLKALLEKEKISGEYLSIEITESIFLDKKDETITFLHKLKDLGIKIALDDFGVGYSSLSYLTFLPVDKIKLDKTLNDKFLIMDDIMVISSIISLAHSLSLEVIAEGIESIEQYLRLKEAGCDCIQGYLFSKPLDIESIDRIYNDNLVQKLQKNIKFCKEEPL